MTSMLPVLIVCAAAGTAGADAAPPEEAVEPDGIVLSDGSGATALVAPAAGGRILAFRPAGAPGNVFWTPPPSDQCV